MSSKFFFFSGNGRVGVRYLFSSSSKLPIVLRCIEVRRLIILRFGEKVFYNNQNCIFCIFNFRYVGETSCFTLLLQCCEKTNGLFSCFYLGNVSTATTRILLLSTMYCITALGEFVKAPSFSIGHTTTGN